MNIATITTTKYFDAVFFIETKLKIEMNKIDFV